MLNLSCVRESDDFRLHVRVVVGELPEAELAARLQCGRRPPLVLHAVKLLLKTLVSALPLLHVHALHSNLHFTGREYAMKH